jgi:hypothetical protein
MIRGVMEALVNGNLSCDVDTLHVSCVSRLQSY